MSLSISGENLSQTWGFAFQALLAQPGAHCANLFVAIENPLVEDPAIRNNLDAFLAARRKDNIDGKQPVQSIKTVANTIFPSAYYRPHLEGDARNHLYKLAKRSEEKRRGVSANRRGTYFDRLISWPGVGDTTALNQLELTVEKLRAYRQRSTKTANNLEISIEAPRDDLDAAHSLSVFRPEFDSKQLMGFPCLSHISFSLMNGRLHMAAVYRNHYFLRRAYGNYVGLARVLDFLSRESGWPTGELTCLSTHATAELGKGKGFGKGNLTTLAKSCSPNDPRQCAA
ncbi:MAG: hypothetical protein GKR94_16030 [Gammaproteobacteria bacterium]|nr:hypothetical protein [Gammaproteobacteria bacterium]